MSYRCEKCGGEIIHLGNQSDGLTGVWGCPDCDVLNAPERLEEEVKGAMITKIRGDCYQRQLRDAIDVFEKNQYLSTTPSKGGISEDIKFFVEQLELLERELVSDHAKRFLKRHLANIKWRINMLEKKRGEGGNED